MSNQQPNFWCFFYLLLLNETDKVSDTQFLSVSLYFFLGHKDLREYFCKQSEYKELTDYNWLSRD